MAEGMTCYERDEAFCEDQMCLRVGCRLQNARLSAESKMPARTPGPWSVGDTGRMVVREVPGMCDGGDYYSVAVTTAHSLLFEGEARANAAFIVEACNQYDALKHRADLVEPLVEALQAIDAMNPHDHGMQGLWTAQKIIRSALSSWEAGQ